MPAVAVSVEAAARNGHAPRGAVATPTPEAGEPGVRLPIVNGTWFLIVFFLKVFVSTFIPCGLPS